MSETEENASAWKCPKPDCHELTERAEAALDQQFLDRIENDPPPEPSSFGDSGGERG